MTSYALAIFLYLNALAATTSYAEEPGDVVREDDPQNPLGAVSTSKLQIHVSIKYYVKKCLFGNFVNKKDC